MPRRSHPDGTPGALPLAGTKQSFMLRMPIALYIHLKDEAARNHRSVNAEVIHNIMEIARLREPFNEDESQHAYWNSQAPVDDGSPIREPGPPLTAAEENQIEWLKKDPQW